MNRKPFLFLFIVPLFFISEKSISQNQYPLNYFSFPLKTYSGLSGNFGELRTNHFHSGLDFRTGGVIGQSILSVADGYVSRIKVSSIGGGKTVYINHPNGFKSVYMHLDKFSGKIADFVQKAQYEHHIFELDIEDILPNLLPVKKGEEIAKSGNTGSSGGPHLHFEIRQADNDMPINPLLFGYKLCDNIAPIIEQIQVYPATKNSTIEHANTIFSLTKKNTAKAKKKANTAFELDTLAVCGKIYLGIAAFDRFCNSVGKNGIYRFEICIDNEKVHAQVFNEFMFEDTRFSNAIIDYPFYLKTKKRFFVSKQPEYVPLPQLYETILNKGIYEFTDSDVHFITIKVFDFAGNSTYFSFFIKSSVPNTEEAAIFEKSTENRFFYSAANQFKNESFFIEMEPYTLYESISFEQSVQKKTSKLHNPICYAIHKEEVPLHKAYTLGIPLNYVPEFFRKKVLVVQINSPNSVTALKSEFENGVLTAYPKSFGLFSTAIDTVSPLLTAVNFSDNATLKIAAQQRLTFKITDNLSGISSYNCYLNQEWILAEYDKKTNTLEINLSGKLQKGKNELKVRIEDACDNFTEKTFSITGIL